MIIDIYFGKKRLILAEQEPPDFGGKRVSSLYELNTFWSGTEELALFPGKVKDNLKLLRKQYKYIKAAGGLVVNSKEEYLLMFRRGKWDLPKGKSEKGETIDQTALREVEEETAVECLTIVEAIPSTYHMYEEKGKTILKRTFWYRMKTDSDQELIPQTEEDIEKVEWLAKKDFGKVLSNTFPSVIAVLKHA